MAIWNIKRSALVVAMALAASQAQAWVTPINTVTPVRAHTAPLRMAEEDQDKVQLTSGRKEIMFDDKTGRFFETGLETGECIPEEEYCTIDDDGKPVRLTVAEKERIFLDSLQVRIFCGRRLCNVTCANQCVRAVLLCEW